MNEPQPQPLKLPKTFDKCPHCGSTRLFCHEALKEHMTPEEILAKNPVLGSIEHILSTPLYTVRVVAIVDVCPDCGTVYAVAMFKQKLLNQPLMPGQGPPRPLFGGRG